MILLLLLLLLLETIHDVLFLPTFKSCGTNLYNQCFKMYITHSQIIDNIVTLIVKIYYYNAHDRGNWVILERSRSSETD